MTTLFTRRRFGDICAALASRRILPAWVGLFIIVIVMVTRTLVPAPFLASQIMIFDAMQRVAPRPYVRAPVRVIDIDEESPKRIGQWPWSRDVLAALTERLTEFGAASIASDFVFSEPDRTSPSILMKRWAATPGLPAASVAAQELPDYDQRFAEAIASGPVVLSMALVGSEGHGVPTPKAGIALLGTDPTGSVSRFPGAITNLPKLDEAAKGVGSFSITGEDGETVRRVPLIARYRDQIVPSLALEALRVAQGADTIGVRRGSESSAGVALAAGLVFLCTFQGVGLSLGALLAVVAAAVAAAWYGYVDHPLLGDPTVVCIAAVPAVIGTALTRYFVNERDGRRLKRAFSQYLAPALVEQVARNSGRLQLGGQTREVSCLFTDLEGFTNFAEHAPADQLVAILNAYLDALCSIAMDHGGTVVKLIGDAVH